MLYEDDNTFCNEFLNQDTSLVDILIGRRIKNRRTILGITQKDLGKIVGVSAQQIQKYETASNRVSCSTLYAFAQCLKTPVDYFFGHKEQNPALSVEEEQEGFLVDEVQEKEIIRLINFYKSINDKSLRKKVYELLEVLGNRERIQIL